MINLNDGADSPRDCKQIPLWTAKWESANHPLYFLEGNFKLLIQTYLFNWFF